MNQQTPHDTDGDEDEGMASELMQTVFDPLKSGLAVSQNQFATQIDFSVLEAELYQPQRRLPNAKLIVIDDHSASEGEVIRIRKREYTIGRTHGDLAIESDLEMSGNHAVLHCKLDEGSFRWRLTDVGSTNGTFVRVAKAPLTEGRELLLGLQRYRVELQDPDNAPPAVGEVRVFLGGAVGAPPVQQPLRLVNTADTSQTYQVLSQRSMLGSNPKRCSVVIEDRCLNAEHARLMYKRGRWQIEDNDSLNGVWVRVRSVWLDRHAEFQLGEQRFRFFADGQVPS
ncbi:FHA domain-containing protein [Roseimaritima ulvae]|uniref:FHA domain protein n=1 Tax=Roseimaritima ulvae TaxID=980254 RepID=A0A5B9QXZ8_9BACT|nr:FHA domain-containing protein [Roseimaritima ulvae]QEG38823.1 FHA domain protein [Roseimaritima ulvae]